MILLSFCDRDSPGSLSWLVIQYGLEISDSLPLFLRAGIKSVDHHAQPQTISNPQCVTRPWSKLMETMKKTISLLYCHYQQTSHH